MKNPLSQDQVLIPLLTKPAELLPSQAESKIESMKHQAQDLTNKAMTYLDQSTAFEFFKQREKLTGTGFKGKLLRSQVQELTILRRKNQKALRFHRESTRKLAKLQDLATTTM